MMAYFLTLSKLLCLQTEVVKEFGGLIVMETTGLQECSLVSVLIKNVQAPL